MQEITKALIKFHNSGAAAKKSANNPFFKSRYASLEEVIETVRAEAGKCGLTFTQLVDFHDNVIFVRTIIMHESGQALEGRTPVVCKDTQDPQKMGSGITYAKRYGLQAAFGLPSEDDDGNAASQTTTKVTKVEPKQAQSQGDF